jgi:hypothetical protein
LSKLIFLDLNFDFVLALKTGRHWQSGVAVVERAAVAAALTDDGLRSARIIFSVPNIEWQ